MKKIPLSQGKFALVDDEDFEWLNEFKWFVSCGYASRNQIYKPVLMHRLILNAALGAEVDHINGNGFDNRRSNLRFATKQQNGFNRGKNRNNKSGFKGVSLHSFGHKWRAHLVVNGKQIHLGMFNDKDEAYAAYCSAARSYHGEFAHD